jgi:hypothetical protein
MAYLLPLLVIPLLVLVDTDSDADGQRPQTELQGRQGSQGTRQAEPGPQGSGARESDGKQHEDDELGNADHHARYDFTLPSAMGLYWLIGNIMAIVQQFVIYFLFTKPFGPRRPKWRSSRRMPFKDGGSGG